MTSRDTTGRLDAPISSTSAGSTSTRTPFASSTIMIVDDEPTTIEILEMFLQGEGYERFVKTTESRNAVALARRERPDVLLLDLMMPEVGGLDVLREIRNDDELKHLPVIILTSSTEPEAKLQALELGATDLLGKPVDPSELALRLKNTLTAKTYQDRLAYYDRLTGLPNRRLFMDRLQRTLRRAATRRIDCALLHIDLDRFKQINDALGHNVGDDLLQGVADRLEQSVRPTDFLGVPGIADIDNPFSRVGGDEFSVLLPGVGAAERAARVARRILASLSKPFRFEDRDLFTTASIGIALFPSDGDDIETLLTNADIAMTHAKKHGRNNFQFYDPSLNVESAERLNLENQLRRAIDRKELRLYYQPKIDIATGRIIGAEALMRWEHPELGIVGPDRFIPIAEETGLITSLGEWALRIGCEQNQAWQNAGLPPISIAINVSPIQFQNGDFVETIRDALRASQMDPRHLILELTEGVIMENPEAAAKMLEAIREMGTRTSVDDFGTGYSSLSSLSRFPIDELKIDRSFIQNVPQDEADAAIVNVILLIGYTLGMTVVAEGVETEEQLAFLEHHGCSTYQGYLRSRPVPAADFERLLRAET
jgi:diguanylate cyclase (GGDEF)-like protein